MPWDLVGIHWYQEYDLVSLVSFALGKEFALVFLASLGIKSIAWYFRYPFVSTNFPSFAALILRV